MKKKLLKTFTAAFFCSFISFAQIAPGSTAPDFTATDVNGVTHNLQSYLDDGKNVLMDVSATWCGPCWAFHQSEVLNDLQNAYGPEGSDEIVVLFIEGDDSTTSSDLNGTGSNTQGNWLNHTDYPIIDDGGYIANLYEIAYFPTLFGICSSTNQVTELNVSYDVNTVKNQLTGLCGGSLNGVANHAALKLSENTVYICGQGDSSLPFSIKNYGNNDITNATLQLKENGNVVSTKNFSGNIGLFEEETGFFDAVSIDVNSTYTVELVNINGETPFNSSDDFTSKEYVAIVMAQEATTSIVTVNITTDYYPGEISWEIQDSNGNTIADGGPYQPGTADSAGGGGADAFAVKSKQVSLPSNDCYNVILKDSYGDGWGAFNSTTAQPGVEIISNGVSIFQENVGNFGSEYTRDDAFSRGQLSTDNFNQNKITIYPNPSKGEIYVSEVSKFDIEIFNVMGKKVYSNKNLNSKQPINLSNLQSGVYFVSILNNNQKQSIKLILE